MRGPGGRPPPPADTPPLSPDGPARLPAPGPRAPSRLPSAAGPRRSDCSAVRGQPHPSAPAAVTCTAPAAAALGAPPAAEVSSRLRLRWSCWRPSPSAAAGPGRGNARPRTPAATRAAARPTPELAPQGAPAHAYRWAPSTGQGPLRGPALARKGVLRNPQRA